MNCSCRRNEGTKLTPPDSYEQGYQAGSYDEREKWLKVFEHLRDYLPPEIDITIKGRKE